MRRRKLLTFTLGAVVTATAGCVGNDDSSTDGGGGGGDGNGDAANTGDGDDTTETTTPTGNGPGDDGSGTDDADPTTDGGEGPRLGDVLRWEDSFVVEQTAETDGGTVELTGRFNAGNRHVTIESQGRTIDVYTVGEDVYIVTSGRCLVNPGEAVRPDADIEVDDEETVIGQTADLRPSGTTTIEGEEMYVYELPESADNTTGDLNSQAIYVSVETGYLRRHEFEQGVGDYHSWGEVDPIEPPDADCQTPPGG